MSYVDDKPPKWYEKDPVEHIPKDQTEPKCKICKYGYGFDSNKKTCTHDNLIMHCVAFE